MAAVERGEFIVLQGAEAAELIREVYALAIRLAMHNQHAIVLNEFG